MAVVQHVPAAETDAIPPTHEEASHSRPGAQSLSTEYTAALQVDGHASWSRIAQALGEPERNVTQRGMALRESGRVAVTAIEITSGTRSCDFSAHQEPCV